jgi:hypothetical protein
MVQNGEEMPGCSEPFIRETLILQDAIHVVPKRGIFFETIFCLFEGPKSTLAENQQVHPSLFRKGQIVGGRSKKGLFIKIPEGIATAHELIEVNEFHTEMGQDGSCRIFELFHPSRDVTAQENRI